MFLKSFSIALVVGIYLSIPLIKSGVERFIDRVMMRRFRWQLWTTNNWCRASDQLQRWVETHPDDPISHPQAQWFLKWELGAYMLWIDAHPDCADNDYLRLLTELIVDEESRPC